MWGERGGGVKRSISTAVIGKAVQTSPFTRDRPKEEEQKKWGKERDSVETPEVNVLSKPETQTNNIGDTSKLYIYFNPCR